MSFTQVKEARAGRELPSAHTDKNILVCRYVVLFAADTLDRISRPPDGLFTLVTEHLLTPFDFFLIQDINSIPDYK